jgi:hypothetical protein
MISNMILIPILADKFSDRGEIGGDWVSWALVVYKYWISL